MVSKGGEELWRRHINRVHDTTDKLRVDAVPTSERRPVYPVPVQPLSILESYALIVKPAPMNAVQRTRVAPYVRRFLL